MKILLTTTISVKMLQEWSLKKLNQVKQLKQLKQRQTFRLDPEFKREDCLRSAIHTPDLDANKLSS